MGSCDCGLFAIAFATAEAHGKDPAVCNFDQTAMKQHLYKCFSNGKLTPFPEKKTASVRSHGLKSRDDIAVHWYCRMPEINDIPMVECSICLKWFHVACCHGSPSVEQLNDFDMKWLCQFCTINWSYYFLSPTVTMLILFIKIHAIPNMNAVVIALVGLCTNLYEANGWARAILHGLSL